MSLRLIMLGGGCGAALMAAMGIAAASVDARHRRLALRLGDWVAPLAPARVSRPSLVQQLAASARVRGWGGHLAVLCGYRLDRQDAYPLRLPLLLLLLAIPALALGHMLGAALGVSLTPASPLLWLGCSQLLFRELHARHAAKLYRQFPDVLAMIVRSVRAGIPLQESLRVVARESLEPTARQFVRVCDQLSIGIRLDEALRDTAARTGVAEYAFFTVALTLQAQTGGSLAETLDNLADVIRKRVALRMRAIALASEARSSAYVLGALPIVTGSLLAVLNYAYLKPLFETPSGNRLLFIGIGMLCGGGFVMRTLIQRSLR